MHARDCCGCTRGSCSHRRGACGWCCKNQHSGFARGGSCGGRGCPLCNCIAAAGLPAAGAARARETDSEADRREWRHGTRSAGRLASGETGTDPPPSDPVAQCITDLSVDGDRTGVCLRSPAGCGSHAGEHATIVSIRAAGHCCLPHCTYPVCRRPRFAESADVVLFQTRCVTDCMGTCCQASVAFSV